MNKKNVLHAILNLSNSYFQNDIENKKSNNRINDVGNGLENYIQNLFLGNLEPTEENIKNIFSFTGMKNHPPDLILRGGDSFEIKKRESLKGQLALNSSYPRNKLFASDKKIAKKCIECEEWHEKDLFYVVGHERNKKLQTMFFVQGTILAAPKEYYEKYLTSIKDVLRPLGSSDTNEIGRFNNVDPLKRTNLRVRGMFGMASPFELFNFYQSGNEKRIAINILLEKEKFFSFPKKDRDRIHDMKNITFLEKELKSPETKNQNLKCVFLSYAREI